jgi:hypothetical protein
MTKVQCRCGAVEVEISAEPIVQFFCHCDDCQAVHGGAYAPESVYPADAVKVVRGDPTTWKLKRNPRFTCPECGTRLFIDVLGRNLRGVNGFLLPPGKFQPAFHVQCRISESASIVGADPALADADGSAGLAVRMAVGRSGPSGPRSQPGLSVDQRILRIVAERPKKRKFSTGNFAQSAETVIERMMQVSTQAN